MSLNSADPSAPPEAIASASIQAEQQDFHSAATHRAIYVYQVPVRIWHWINAGAILALCLTGYLIGSPLDSLGGEAIDHYRMGYIRFAHFAAGYILAVGLLGRIYWGFAGNLYAKELFWVPTFQLEYWKDVWGMMKWYAFISERPGQYIGHNPLARFAMFFCFFVPCVFMVLSGFALYGEGQQAGSWFDGVFGWMIPLLGQSQDVHTWHHFGMWVMISFMIIHIYAAIREEILGRSSMVSTMISGYRTFKE